MSNARPYTPMFMELTGADLDGPGNGFGADYDAGYFATGLVAARPNGNCRDDLIVVESPAAGAVLGSPVEIKGCARGSWFFEGDFPVVLEDANGKILARSFVTAQDEWMTKDFVPFSGTLSFANPGHAARGMLTFKKDNPTGRPEFHDSTAIPIFFSD